ncbi:YozQ family protein [Bacillus salipaludis]|uniref:YozQ family protein n=1 Tax=Bacillus salipaludis TaxID=2547811 RepID=UPI003D2608D2
MTNKEQNNNSEIAGRIFHTDDYQKKDQLSSGLATTHEQVSDTYMEGEIGAVIDNVNGTDIPLNSD